MVILTRSDPFKDFQIRMRMHALRVGAFASVAYVACLLWPLTMLDQAVKNFHLLSLKVLFPGFSGYDPLSLIWGGVLAFTYGYLFSIVFHLLHGDCCGKQKKNGNGIPFLIKNEGVFKISIIFALGVLLGLMLSRPLGLFSGASKDVRPFMKNGGAAMMQWGRMMQDDGGAISNRGSYYGDQDMMRRGETMMERGQRMQQDGQWMMQKGDE